MFARSKKHPSSKPAPFRKTRLDVENLGERNLMAVSVFGSSDGIFDAKDFTMKIIGDSADNAITVQWDKKDPLTAYDDLIVVRDHGKIVGSVNPWEGNFGFKGVQLTNIKFEGGDGNDSFSVIGSLKVYPEGIDDYNPSGALRIVAYGGKGNDVLSGSNDDTSDMLDGGAGNDTIFGLGGNDYLYGGDGNDNIFGGAGNDYIEGGLGNDYVSGDGGNDTVFGDVSPTTAGAQYLFYAVQGGKDSLYGGDGDDTIYGDGGDDSIFGNAGADKLYGDALDGDNSLEVGSDTLVGDSEASTGYADTLVGGKGNDLLKGGPGNDAMYGNDGNDSLFGGTGNDTILGQKGNDIVYAGDGNDAIYGGDDMDLLWGDKGNDVMFGGAGNDTLYGNDGNDVMAGEDGNDVLKGGADNDSMSGGKGKDELYGEDGNDYLEGGSYGIADGVGDTLSGGNGSDKFFVEYVQLLQNQWYNRDKPVLFNPNYDTLIFP